MQDKEKGLEKELKEHFKTHGRRMEMLVKLILGLLMLGSLNYSKLSKVINPRVQRSSNFKRVQRFMRYFNWSRRSYIQLVWSLFVGKKEFVLLSIDRTNWKFGRKDINILLLGISYKGTAIPLVWKLLNKRGNSDTSERIELMESLFNELHEFQKQQVRCLLADREFIGQDWISYLKKQSYNFIIRIRSNTRVRKIGSIKSTSARAIFKESSYKVLRKKRVLWNHQLYLGGQKNGNKDWLILISNIPLSQGKTYYGERWGIEVFFSACKTKGFNFEDTHVTKHDRLFNLIFLIAIAFIGAIKTGEWLLKNGKTIPIKTLEKRKAKLYSIFRIGFDHLQELLLNFLTFKDEFRLLSCT